MTTRTTTFATTRTHGLAFLLAMTVGIALLTVSGMAQATVGTTGGAGGGGWSGRGLEDSHEGDGKKLN